MSHLSWNRQQFHISNAQQWAQPLICKKFLTVFLYFLPPSSFSFPSSDRAKQDPREEKERFVELVSAVLDIIHSFSFCTAVRNPVKPPRLLQKTNRTDTSERWAIWPPGQKYTSQKQPPLKTLSSELSNSCAVERSRIYTHTDTHAVDRSTVAAWMMAPNWISMLCVQ